MKPILISVGGGSASGKTTVVEEIVSELNTDSITVISQDDYYKDQTDLSMEERIKTNYDHPSSLDNERLIKDLSLLLSGQPIKKPIYDFIHHNRKKEFELVSPSEVIILEGIMALQNEQIREMSNIKIFVESDDDIRFIRRLKRDIYERGRTMENVINQYLDTVKPMYYQFIKPTKRYADIIIPNDKKHNVAVDIIVAKLRMIMKG